MAGNENEGWRSYRNSEVAVAGKGDRYVIRLTVKGEERIMVEVPYLALFALRDAIGDVILDREGESYALDAEPLILVLSSLRDSDVEFAVNEIIRRVDEYKKQPPIV